MSVKHAAWQADTTVEKKEKRTACDEVLMITVMCEELCYRMEKIGCGAD
jgi:hypothetical protein